MMRWRARQVVSLLGQMLPRVLRDRPRRAGAATAKAQPSMAISCRQRALPGPRLPCAEVGLIAYYQPVSHLRPTAFSQRQPSAMKSGRSEEHTSELQSLMRISYAVFCLKKKKHTHNYN